ncbi:IS66 family transposase [Streptomyces griseofuscus]|uniref:IS66 family transposase n=2 Tax=Streptomyces TaxID=1883 RepID=UPI0034568E8F
MRAVPVQEAHAEALAQLFGTPLSAGTVAAMTKRMAAEITESGFCDLVKAGPLRAPVVHFDETGMRVAARLHWVHSASTDRFSLITVHERRGVKGIEHAGILPRYLGVAVHDAWAPYDTYGQATRALCAAHALRELVAVTETAADEQTAAMTERVIEALRELKAAAEEARDAGRDAIDAQAKTTGLDGLRAAILAEVAPTAERSTKRQTTHHALFRRLRDRFDDYTRWVRHLYLPFDNNAAEREIRMIKVRQKVSGFLRTQHGARQFATIRSYLATAVKHDIRFIDALVHAAEGNPWLPSAA